MYEFFLSPFLENAFMMYALLACAGLALGSAPIGVFLTLRRMSLIGDALGHAVLPGVAIGYMVYGLSLTAMSVGGLIAALLVLLGAGLIARFSVVREDASMTAFYLMSLALGVILISKWGTSVDLMHILFGNVLTVSITDILFLSAVSTITLMVTAVLYRAWVLESFDALFFKSTGGGGALAHAAFLMLLALNMVAGFQALGTLMAVGLMMLPAITARLWVRHINAMVVCATVIGVLSAFVGLLLAFYWDFPPGPAIILCAGIWYILSLIVGPQGGVLWKVILLPHFKP